MIDDVVLRAIGPDDVHVRLAASGVCRSDLSIQDGTIPHPIPAVLGHEGAGVVVDCGERVSSLAAGDHVILSWVAPCRRCFYCLRGHPELCEHGLDHAFAQPYATASDGTALLAAFGTATFGEETIVPEAACVRVDHDFPLELARARGVRCRDGCRRRVQQRARRTGCERGGGRLRRRRARSDPRRAARRARHRSLRSTASRRSLPSHARCGAIGSGRRFGHRSGISSAGAHEWTRRRLHLRGRRAFEHDSSSVRHDRAAPARARSWAPGVSRIRSSSARCS